MKIMRIVVLGTFSLAVAAQARAAVRSDFGGLAICSKLKAMPKGYRALACNMRAPLRGECRFTLTSNGVPIDYLLENGVVLDKAVKLSAGAKFVAPFGLRHSDNAAAAARKIKDNTGLSAKLWTDHEDDNASYLQSEDVICGKAKSYSVYVWFENNKATSVSVSTLPAI